jgi:predicted nucleotidyltransferase
MENSGLTAVMLDKIKAVFIKYSQVDSVIIYGSRAMGNYKPYSDIDLTLIGTGINLSLLTKIEFDLDDLLLPYKFDISIFNKITNTDLIIHIQQQGKEIYKKSES